MKKILFSTLLFWAGISFANPTINYVWVHSLNGVLETQCRTIWREYDAKFGTNTIIVQRPGAFGLIATNHMLADTAERKFMCGSSSDLVSNALVYPGRGDELEPLLQTITNTAIWYVPNSNKARSLPELITYFKSLNRPINVGVFFALQHGIVKYLEKTYDLKINMINYRSGPQMYPDLASGSLDLAFDSGAGVDAAQETNKFRIVGYFSETDREKLKDYPNFKHSTTNLPYYSWFVIMVPPDMNTELKLATGKALREIIVQQTFKDLATQTYATVSPLMQPEIGRQVIYQRKILEKYLK